MSDAQLIAMARAILETDDNTCVVRARIIAELTALLAEVPNGH